MILSLGKLPRDTQYLNMNAMQKIFVALYIAEKIIVRGRRLTSLTINENL